MLCALWNGGSERDSEKKRVRETEKERETERWRERERERERASCSSTPLREGISSHVIACHGIFSRLGRRRYDSPGVVFCAVVICSTKHSPLESSPAGRHPCQNASRSVLPLIKEVPNKICTGDVAASKTLCVWDWKRKWGGTLAEHTRGHAVSTRVSQGAAPCCSQLPMARRRRDTSLRYTHSLHTHTFRRPSVFIHTPPNPIPFDSLFNFFRVLSYTSDWPLIYPWRHQQKDADNEFLDASATMGWLRLVGSLKL